MQSLWFFLFGSVWFFSKAFDTVSHTLFRTNVQHTARQIHKAFDEQLANAFGSYIGMVAVISGVSQCLIYKPSLL